MSKPAIQTSIHGRRFGLSAKSELIVNDANAKLQDAVITPLARERVLISAAAAAAAFSTPVEIVAAPGTGFALLPRKVIVSKAAGTAFGGIAAGEDIRIAYGTAAIQTVGDIETTGFLDQTTDEMRVAYALSAASGLDSVDLNALANDNIEFSLLVGDLTGGSDLVVDIQYEVFDLTALLA
jgi:hypothetical protein